MRKLIQVLPRHILKGSVNDPNACPVSWAASEAAGFQITAHIGQLIAYGGDYADKRWSVPMPKSVKRAVAHYDTTGEMDPFNFYMEIPA